MRAEHDTTGITATADPATSPGGGAVGVMSRAAGRRRQSRRVA